MTSASTHEKQVSLLPTLPSDDVRQIMWRFQDAHDLQKVLESTRSVARGVVARLVADGARNTDEGTAARNLLLAAFDEAGIGALLADPEQRGVTTGQRNLATALALFELAWVDGGAAVCSLASGLALEPIIEKGTPEQKQEYLGRCAPPSTGQNRAPARGAFCLAEPLPAPADTERLRGKVRVFQWKDGQQPILEVDKCGWLVTNMDFADFVVAAVESDDERVEGTCMIILEKSDDGVYDRGEVTHKLASQLVSARNPVFKLKVPASRMVGGYTVQEGVIVPNYNLDQILETVFGRVRVATGVMAAARLLSSVEPIIRRQRGRFPGDARLPGGRHYDRGLPTAEGALHRLVDVWATGEAASSLGFAAARHFDCYDLLDRDTDTDNADGDKDRHLAAENAKTPAEILSAREDAQKLALEYLELDAVPDHERDEPRLAELKSDKLAQFLIEESVVNVLSPATKLWNTNHGANMMREAVNLMGGDGITEDCPGFLPQKLLDAQLETMYEEPESVARDKLATAMTNELFLAQFRRWIGQMRQFASTRSATGVCTVASAMDLWHWTLMHLREVVDADGEPVYRDARHSATSAMADALCWLLASRYQIIDVLELESKGGARPDLSEVLPGCVQFFTDLCHVQSARAAGEVGRICAELVFGFRRHPSWDADCEGCIAGDEIDALENLIPGIAYGARIGGDVLEADGSHAQKAGPCVQFTGLQGFLSRRSKLDGCLTGARLAKERAEHALTQVAIPPALDYPR